MHACIHLFMYFFFLSHSLTISIIALAAMRAVQASPAQPPGGIAPPSSARSLSGCAAATHLDGDISYPDKAIYAPGGVLSNLDRSAHKLDGATCPSGGATRPSDGAIYNPDRAIRNPVGATCHSDGVICHSGGATCHSDGATRRSDGATRPSDPLGSSLTSQPSESVVRKKQSRACSLNSR